MDIGGGNGGGGSGGRGGAVALALLGSRRGWAADAVARAARSQPRAKVGEGQQCSRVHPWTSAAVMAPAGGGGAALGGRWRRSWRRSLVTYRA